MTNITKADLLPCPFCGGAGRIGQVSDHRISYPRTGHRGECRNCSVKTGAFDFEEEAIAAWNTRAALQDKAVEVAVAIDNLHNERRDGMTNAIFPPVQIGTRLFAAQPAPVVPDDVARDAARYRLIRDGGGWPAAFAAHDAPEPLRGDDLDAAMIAASQQKGGQ